MITMQKTSEAGETAKTDGQTRQIFSIVSVNLNITGRPKIRLGFDLLAKKVCHMQ